jgi:hypothetical protein
MAPCSLIYVRDFVRKTLILQNTCKNPEQNIRTTMMTMKTTKMKNILPLLTLKKFSFVTEDVALILFSSF